MEPEDFTAAKVIEDFCFRKSQVHENLFVKKLRGYGLDDITIAKVINALDDVCLDCFDTDVTGYNLCHCDWEI